MLQVAIVAEVDTFIETYLVRRDEQGRRQVVKNGKLPAREFHWAALRVSAEGPRRAVDLLYDFPAEHWSHLWTTNPIESTFAAIRLRHRKTEGVGLARLSTVCVRRRCRKPFFNWSL